MVVVPHDAEGVADPSVSFNDVSKNLEECLAIRFVKEDILSRISTAR